MRTLPFFAACCLTASLALSACGGEKKSIEGSRESQVPRAPSVAGFPQGKDLTLAQLGRRYKEALIFAPSGAAIDTGSNRLGFVLFDIERTLIKQADVAIYAGRTKNSSLRGPIPVRFEPITLRPAYRSQTTASDKDAVSGIYIADADFPKGGSDNVVALVKTNKGLVSTTVQPIKVGIPNGPPRVGEKAISVHTPVASEVADIGSIDTRVPPGTMHEHDLAKVLGKMPIVLTFATPQLCQSRVCGPVVDVAEQVKAKYDKKAAFIHMEIYNDNDISKGFRPQVGAWRLPSEPWTFVINKDRTIAARFEGALSVRELDRAVAKVVQRG